MCVTNFFIPSADMNLESIFSQLSSVFRVNKERCKSICSSMYCYPKKIQTGHETSTRNEILSIVHQFETRLLSFTSGHLILVCHGSDLTLLTLWQWHVTIIKSYFCSLCSSFIPDVWLSRNVPTHCSNPDFSNCNYSVDTTHRGNYFAHI